MRRMRRAMRNACVAGLVLMLSACASSSPKPGAWQPLFDGVSTRGWHNVGKTTLDPRWQAIDGALVLTAAGGGDIVSDAQFDDFELELDWQLAPGGNSGVFYRAADSDPVWQRATEYQLLDDAAAEDRFVASHRAGSVYDLVAAEGSVLRAPGEYNHARIVACGPRVEHWLNGVRVASYTIGSEDWRQRLAASKFAGQANFAAARAGHIGLQDHGAVLRLRNARIRASTACVR
jgi:hypothetical protein